MAQTKTQTKSQTEPQGGATEQTTERIRELNERIIDASRRAGGSYLDVYERTLSGMADFQEKLGETSQVDLIQNMANLQAKFLRETAKAYTQTMRELLK